MEGRFEALHASGVTGELLRLLFRAAPAARGRHYVTEVESEITIRAAFFWCRRLDKPMKQKTQRTVSISAILAMSVLHNAGVLAQTSRDWRQCTGREGPIVDVVIEGCTAVIQAGQDSPQKLAVAFDNRGVAYRLKGDYDRALQDYEHAIRLNPNSANPYNNRGIIYRIKGDYDRAIADYDEAIWLKSGDYPAAFYNRALAYTDKGDYDHALTDFDVVNAI